MFMFGNGGERVGKEVWGLCDDCIEELRIQKMPIVEEEGGGRREEEGISSKNIEIIRKLKVSRLKH